MYNITFFGLGNMGLGMASNLVNAGNKVTVYDLVESHINDMVSKGALAGADPADSVKDAEIIISMLPAGKHVKQLYDGIMQKSPSNTLFIDCSTIDAVDAIDLHKLCKDNGHHFVDAPVSGGVAGAAAGTLTFIMGGDTAAVEQATPILKQMGKHCFHAGGEGAGQIAKICNNMLLAIIMAGTSETLKLAIDNGLDPKVMSDIMKQSSGNNWTLQQYNPVPNVMANVPSSKGYKGGFMVDLMNKDLHLAMNAAAATHSIVPMGGLAKSLYQLHGLNGNGKKDFSSIYEAYLQE